MSRNAALAMVVFITIIFFLVAARPTVAIAAVTEVTTTNASNEPAYLLHSVKMKRV